MSTAGDRKQWELSKAIMTYWSNFIKTGNPNNPTHVKEQWLPFNTHDEYYLYLDLDVTSARKRCKARRTDFWLDFLPKVKAASGRYQDNVNSDCSSSGEGQTQPYVWTLLVVTVLGEMASLVNHS
ncbi:hypothetical protein BaRGS_00008597 [Batillaria attramentaria]|uniref:Carboxylesterase type B domain-containing protein n=1 Tax=Batillaria attramentaria TaxID=370345 RepID=A0ABD0LKR9_9CAEN